MRRALQAAKPYAVIVLSAACCTAVLYLLTVALVSMGVLHPHDHACEESK
jgi:hypothetical protein